VPKAASGVLCVRFAIGGDSVEMFRCISFSPSEYDNSIKTRTLFLGKTSDSTQIAAIAETIQDLLVTEITSGCRATCSCV
jgi:hypothetical protein